MTTMLDFPDALESAGVNVRVMDGWEQPHSFNGVPYVYREDDDDPAGHMHHHVGTESGNYTPNRDKANGYAGLSYFGSDKLFQEKYHEHGYEAVYTVANAYPAPISSGAGDYTVLERVRRGNEVVGRQGPDTPGYFGNTHYWNTEWCIDGRGSWIDPSVWEMMRVVTAVQNELMGWTPNMHIGHGHHTRRKPDLWVGQYANFDKTIEALREDMTIMMTTERWATRLRRPLDTDRMVDVGILTEDERDYWGAVPLYLDAPENKKFNDEFQDLRDAVEVRKDFWK